MILLRKVRLIANLILELSKGQGSSVSVLVPEARVKIIGSNALSSTICLILV